jgi:hypothetical protein
MCPPTPETGSDAHPAWSGSRPRGGEASGAVTLSDVDARPAVVEVGPGGMAPAGQGHRDQRADIDRQALPGPGPAVPKRPSRGSCDRGIERWPGDIAQGPGVGHGVVEAAVGGGPGLGGRLDDLDAGRLPLLVAADARLGPNTAPGTWPRSGSDAPARPAQGSSCPTGAVWSGRPRSRPAGCPAGRRRRPRHPQGCPVRGRVGWRTGAGRPRPGRSSCTHTPGRGRGDDRVDADGGTGVAHHGLDCRGGRRSARVARSPLLSLQARRQTGQRLRLPCTGRRLAGSGARSGRSLRLMTWSTAPARGCAQR